MDDHHATGSATHLFHIGQERAAHGTEYAPGECITRECGQHRTRPRVDGQIAATRDNGCRVACNVFVLAEQCQGFTAFVEGHLNHFGALGNEQAALRIHLMAQLRFGERAENLHSRM